MLFITPTVRREPTNHQWIRYEAQDPSGQVWGYSHKPLRTPNGWYVMTGTAMKVAEHGCTPTSWKKSLVRIKYE